MSKVYSIITDKILARLDEGIIPWQKPWVGGELMLPKRWNGESYKGINAWLLMEQYKYPFYFGLGKIKELGGRIKHEEFLKSNLVVFNKPIIKGTKLNKKGKEVENRRFVFVYHKVWNIDQIENMELTEPLQILKAKIDNPISLKPFEKINKCEEIIHNYKQMPEVRQSLSKAFYSPTFDYIKIPSELSFNSSEAYYATLFHEMIHSTGHKDRLKRDLEMGSFGDEVYSKEELVAEFGASYLCGMAQIENVTINNSIAYIQSWKQKLKSDPKLIVQASRLAQKACDYLLGVTKEKDSE